jgi:4-hydroxy-tetrahydrodipicolinate reductase
MIGICINGACGRMGKTLAKCIQESGEFKISGAVERQDHPDIGKDYGRIVFAKELGIKLAPKINQEANVVIDFSIPHATMMRLQECIEYSIPIVICTTGFDQTQQEIIKNASTTIPILQSSNMSFGANIVIRILSILAGATPQDYDIDIIETHHRYKKDAPSGTAITIVREITKAKGIEPAQIKIHSIRAGDIIGEHRVIFSTGGEQIEVVHRVTTREIFAKGALVAAKFLMGARPDYYTMADAIGL